MANVKRTPDNQGEAGEQAEAEVKSFDGQAGRSKKSSRDTMSHPKANSHEVS